MTVVEEKKVNRANMEMLVVVMLIAAIAPATSQPAFPFPTVDGVLNLHYPGSDQKAGNVLFWRISRTPSDIATDISLSSFSSGSNHVYIALVYNASHITDTCRPVGPPLTAYNEVLQEYQPMVLFSVESSDTGHNKYSIPPRKASFDPADANNILNHTVVMYPVLTKSTALLNEFLDWKNTPNPALCGLIEPASLELRQHVAPEGWEAAEKEIADAIAIARIEMQQLETPKQDSETETPKPQIKCPSAHRSCLLRFG